MKHKGLIFGVALAMAALVFLLFWLASVYLGFSLWVGAFFALLVFGLALGLTSWPYARSTRVLNRLCRTYGRESLLYADIAGLTEDRPSFLQRRREHPGGLVVTVQRLVFEAPDTLRGQRWDINLAFGEITGVQNRRGYFVLNTNDSEFVFKVFQCDTLVQIIETQIEATKPAPPPAAEEQPDAPAQAMPDAPVPSDSAAQPTT